ncbi:MAG TPA: DUF2127 domain-containing protein [Candidatus Acidoferrales bacterium]|nr:DUF2127 domain-containing protein [Candidatus Acidoferrales bacterium]
MARPTGVTILAVLSFLGAAFCLLAAAGMFIIGSSAGMAAMAGKGGMNSPLMALGAFAGVACLIFAVLYIVNGVGLWKLQGWARLLTILLIVVGIVFEVMGIVRAMAPMHVGIIVWELILIVIDVWILMYLFKPRVKAAFGERTA